MYLWKLVSIWKRVLAQVGFLWNLTKYCCDKEFLQEVHFSLLSLSSETVYFSLTGEILRCTIATCSFIANWRLISPKSSLYRNYNAHYFPTLKLTNYIVLEYFSVTTGAVITLSLLSDWIWQFENYCIATLIWPTSRLLCCVF